MAVIRISEPVWEKTYRHLFARTGEHFGFMLARVTSSCEKPVFMVHDVQLLSDDQVVVTRTGWEVSVEAIVKVINSALRSGDALIEVHNHGGSQPKFSYTDRRGLEDFPAYVLSSLPGRPYGATVWGDSTVYGEYFVPDGRTRVVDSITVVGRRIRQIVSREDDQASPDVRFDRQLLWFTPEGQRMLGRLRAAIVGIGGTGSQVVQGLTFVGIRDFVLIDHQDSEKTNMNRLVTAKARDVGDSKVLLGERLVKAIEPRADVTVIKSKLQSSEALDTLKGVDVIFGGVDNDGARLILNQLSKAYGIPYFDMAVGIHLEEGKVTDVGGRVAVITPEGPCLYCMKEIDIEEAGYYLSSEKEQDFTRARGYVEGMDATAPSVVSLNGLIANAAINEFLTYSTGQRALCFCADYDLLGIGREIPGQYLTPRRVGLLEGCVHCSLAWQGDRAGIERYVTE